MAARRQVTNKLRTLNRKASKLERGAILDRVVDPQGWGARRPGGCCRSEIARSERTGRRAHGAGADLQRRRQGTAGARVGVDGHAVREVPGGDTGAVTAAAGRRGGSGHAVRQRAGTGRGAVDERAATVDRYLKPVRDRMRFKGISTTKPSSLLRNSITIRTCADEAPDTPGVIEADTVTHCGPTLIGELARTLTMTDMVTGWTENRSILNQRFDVDRGRCPGALAVLPVPHDHLPNAWCASTRSTGVTTPRGELRLLGRLWRLVSLRYNSFAPARKAVGLRHHHGRPPQAHLQQAQDSVAACASIWGARHAAIFGRSCPDRRDQPGQSDSTDQLHPDATTRPRRGQGRGPPGARRVD